MKCFERVLTMKSLLLLCVAILPLICFGQRKQRDRDVDATYQTRPNKKNATMKPLVLSRGPALIALGGLFLGGSQVYMMNAGGGNVKTTTTILSAAGGVSVFIGGVILGNALTKFSKIQPTARISFKGNAICMTF